MAATELALLLPFLIFLLAITVDFARVYYFTTVATFMARDGAAFAASNDNPMTSTYTNTTEIQNAAFKDDSFASSNPFSLPASNIVVTGTAGTSNHIVAVTVSYTFNPVISFPGIPSNLAITRTCKMRILQSTPD